MNNELYETAKNTIEHLKQHDLTVATAESCTGGMVSSFITSVPGVSSVFELGITSYSCRIKNKILGVKQETLDQYGAVSDLTAKEMAERVRILADSDIGVSVTGVAGPSSSEGHEPGTVYIALSSKKETNAILLSIKPISRNYIRESVVKEIFKMIDNYIKEL